MNSFKNKIVFGLVAFLLVSNIFAWQIVFGLSAPQYLEVNFFDVGQGDAIFIETPLKQQIVIDGGPNSRILEKLGREMPFYDRTIDLVILTHPEKDHLFGLLEVLKRYKIKNILWTGVIRDTQEWREWTDLIQKEGAVIKIAKAGDKIILQKGIFINILNPAENLNNKEIKDSNDTSIVFSLIVGDNKFLFTGDISSKIEEQLIKKDIGSDVLKISHHGSKYSTPEEFLKIVLPVVAVIQVGKNSYGHPTQEILQRLEKFGIEILRTDEDGDIKIISDGNNFRITTNN